MKNVNYLSLIAAVIGALKIILQSFGIVIPDELANDVANGAAAVMTIIGIFMSHRKEVAPSGSNSIAESNK